MKSTVKPVPRITGFRTITFGLIMDPKILLANCIAVVGILLSGFCYGETLEPVAVVGNLHDDIMAPEDLSAIARLGSFLVIGSDEDQK